MALDRAQVLRAALDLIDAEGLGKLSMRRIGAALGVEAMSLYRYVDGKADLLDGVHAILLADLPALRPGDSWEVALRQQAHALRRGLAAHPRAVPLVATRAAAAQDSLAHVDALLLVLMDLGLCEAEAVHALQTVFVFVMGHAMFHLAGGADSLEAQQEFAFGLDVLVRGMPMNSAT